ncbi:Hypothetical predicted protein, partial [Mytilus galloprovincialis]
MLISDREKTLKLLTNLGFVVNLEKSSLIPTQSITYIGAVFSLKEGMVRPTSERVSKLLSAVELILNKQNQATARDFLQLLGIMASCIELIPNARLFMRPIQLHLLYHWKPVCQNLGIKIPFSKHLKGHLRWWLKIENLVIGRSITPWETSITVTTDASNSGYGGHINNSLIVQGTWSVEEKLLHINSLEMEAVFLTVKHFLPNFDKQKCSYSVRQFNRCSLHKQTRRHSFSSAVYENLETLAISARKSNFSESCTHCRKKEHSSRPFKQ